MTEIDELEGVELAAAVALNQGWKVNADGIWCDSTGEMTQYDEIERSPDYYCPDEDIAQAWELFLEMLGKPCYEVVDIRYIRGRFCIMRPLGNIMTSFASGNTAPVAICRAFLKAKAVT